MIPGAKRIWVVFDTDRGGIEGARRAAKLIEERYRDVDLYVVKLPTEVKDLDGYCEKFQTAEFGIQLPQKGLSGAIAATRDALHRRFGDAATVPDRRSSPRPERA